MMAMARDLGVPGNHNVVAAVATGKGRAPKCVAFAAAQPDHPGVAPDPVIGSSKFDQRADRNTAGIGEAHAVMSGAKALQLQRSGTACPERIEIGQIRQLRAGLDRQRGQ